MTRATTALRTATHVAAISVIACGWTFAAPVLAASDDKDKAACEAVASIGVARMDNDGVITLRVRSLPPGPVGEAELKYPPSHPDYDKVKQHLGGIAPNETKNVRPWC